MLNEFFSDVSVCSIIYHFPAIGSCTKSLLCVKHIDMIENVQKRATKQIPGMKNLSYEERLRKLELPTLSYRRLRGDMIEVYKIIVHSQYFLAVYSSILLF
jgi:plasmid maintenance system killer protein